jgi:hypothetical protein
MKDRDDMETNDEILPRLYERDIDVLLQEELIFNGILRAVFVTALSLSDELQINQCGLSVVDVTGETDLVADFSSGTMRGKILIENKIDAAFQPLQPQRYKDRVEAIKQQGHSCYCVLIAPSSYLRSNPEGISYFNGTISYEDLASAIGAESTPRANYRAALVMRAVEQAKKSYILIPAENVTAFWNRVYQLACAEYPELKMKRPGKKGSYSHWLSFKGNLPSRIVIDWKANHSVVDLSFWEGAIHHPKPASDLLDLPEGTRQENVGNTRLIRISISTAPPNWSEMADDQIREALNAGRVLLKFYEENRSTFVAMKGR